MICDRFYCRDSSLAKYVCSRRGWNSDEHNSCWRRPRIPIPHAFSVAGKCNFHNLSTKTSQVNNSADVFCSRVCKERIKHNHITPTGLGRIDTHTQMHKRTHPALEKVGIVAQLTHQIYLVFLIQDNLSEIPRGKKNVAEVSVLLGKESRTTFYRKLHKHSSCSPSQLKNKMCNNVQDKCSRQSAVRLRYMFSISVVSSLYWEVCT